MTMATFQDEVTALCINLAEERAAREQVEAENRELVNDLMNLSMDFDDLVRHSHKQGQELDASKQALEVSTKECKSLKKRMKQTHESVKTNMLASQKVVKELQVQLQWKDAVCKGMKRRLKQERSDEEWAASSSSSTESSQSSVSSSVGTTSLDTAAGQKTLGADAAAAAGQNTSSGTATAACDNSSLSAYFKKVKSCSSLDLQQGETTKDHRAGEPSSSSSSSITRGRRKSDPSRVKPTSDSCCMLSKIEECKELHNVIGASFFHPEEDHADGSFEEELHVLGNGTARKTTCFSVSDDERSLPDRNATVKRKPASAKKAPSHLIPLQEIAESDVAAGQTSRSSPLLQAKNSPSTLTESKEIAGHKTSSIPSSCIVKGTGYSRTRPSLLKIGAVAA